MDRLFDFEKTNVYKYPSTITEIDQMKGTEFEIFIGNYLKEFENYEIQYTENMDHGIDIIAISDGKRYGIQCKRYGPNTKIEENQLTQMQVGVKHYGISYRDEDNKTKPYLIVCTTATKDQVSQRGRNYINNNDIIVFHRVQIVEMLKRINKKYQRETKDKDYENIAYNSTKQNKGSYKQTSDLVNLLKEERKKIAKYNKISPLYLVYNDKVISEIIENKPKTISELKKIKGLSNKNVELFGPYLVSRLKSFYKTQTPSSHEEIEENDSNVSDEKQQDTTQTTDSDVATTNSTDSEEDFIQFLKELRKRISQYNDLKPIYLVYNNKTLDEIAHIKPTTIEELKHVKGLGEKKCDLFGAYLVSQVKKYFNQ